MKIWLGYIFFRLNCIFLTSFLKILEEGSTFIRPQSPLPPPAPLCIYVPNLCVPIVPMFCIVKNIALYLVHLQIDSEQLQIYEATSYKEPVDRDPFS